MLTSVRTPRTGARKKENIHGISEPRLQQDRISLLATGRAFRPSVIDVHSRPGVASVLDADIR